MNARRQAQAADRRGRRGAAARSCAGPMTIIEVLVAARPQRARSTACAPTEPAVVTLDLGLPPDPDGVSEGFAALETILSLKPETKVIVASGHGARESALRAIASGAYDFYQKPVDIDAARPDRAPRLPAARASRARTSGSPSQVGDDRTVLGTMITAAPEMIKVARTIERVANTDVSVMLLGASAAPARNCSPAASTRPAGARPGGFVAINCAAIPENLLESRTVRLREGRVHRRDQDHRGQDRAGPWRHAVPRRGRRHSAAAAGQAAALPAGAGDRADRRPQADRGRHAHRLRHPPESGGDDRRRAASARISIIASPRSWCSIPIARRAATAMPRCSPSISSRASPREMNPQVKGFAPDALAAIDAWAWPGNVRELENRVKRAVIMADGKLVTAEDLDLAGAAAEAPAGQPQGRARERRPQGDPPGAGRRPTAISRAPPSCSGSAGRRSTTCSSNMGCRP